MMSTLRSRVARRRGQSMVEYALVLAFVIAFLYAIRGYFTTHMSGTIIAGVKKYEEAVTANVGAVTPYAPTTASTSSSTDTMNYQGTGAVTQGATSDSTQNSTSTF